MVDIYTEISSFTEDERMGTIASLLEEILAQPLDPSRHSNLICIECCEVVQIIEKLDAQVLAYKDLIKKRFDESSSSSCLSVQSRNDDDTNVSSSSPPTNTVTSYACDYSDPVLDLKMPLHFLDGGAGNSCLKDDDSSNSGGGHLLPAVAAAKKTKLQILAETLEEAEMEGMVAAALQMNEEEEDKMLEEEEEVEVIGEDATAAPLPFSCGFCNRTFRQAVMLRKHLKIHTNAGQQPQPQPPPPPQQQQQHTCPECRKSFPTRAVLQNHLRSHSHVKPFKCDGCLKDFKSKHSLNEHVLLKHKGEKVFGCSICGEQFSSKHMRAVHERFHKVRLNIGR